jgi:hypothetical protein
MIRKNTAKREAQGGRKKLLTLSRFSPYGLD